MADIRDIFLPGFGPGQTVTAPMVPIDRLIMPPAPGDFDLGGIVNQILQRIPIPRPRLPLPKPGPRGPTTTGPTFPFPIPFPIPPGLLGGDVAGCPTCCKGEHIAKTTDPNSPSFGQCVKNRRMNSLNPRALRRATRRLKGFERAVRGTRKQLRTLAKI